MLNLECTFKLSSAVGSHHFSPKQYNFKHIVNLSLTSNNYITVNIQILFNQFQLHMELQIIQDHMRKVMIGRFGRFQVMAGLRITKIKNGQMLTTLEKDLRLCGPTIDGPRLHLGKK